MTQIYDLFCVGWPQTTEQHSFIKLNTNYKTSMYRSAYKFEIFKGIPGR